jgi:hypothetical protein
VAIRQSAVPRTSPCRPLVDVKYGGESAPVTARGPAQTTLCKGLPISTPEQTFLDLAGIGVGLVHLVVVADGMHCWSAERSGSAGVSSQIGDCTSQSADASLLEMANVASKRPRARNASRPCRVSLMQCPFRSAPASGAGAEKKSGDLFASCSATERSRSI